LARALGAVEEDDGTTESAEARFLLKRYAQHGYAPGGLT
jgi:hypothetical protein